MAFTKEELIGKSYEELSTSDALAENADVLNSLSNKEKNELATKMIADCPSVKFKAYRQQLEALRHATKTDTFYSVITEAYLVRQHIFALTDPRNKKPHSLLIGEEFNPELYHRFKTLAQRVLENNEPAIAENLALCAPANARSQLAHNIEIAFPKSTLSKEMQAAFTIRRNIDSLLLGNKPEQFFISRDYNKDACNQFAKMFRTLLKGHEEEIATKLALVSGDARTKITHQLDLLSTEVFDQTNPFKQIAESMHAKISAEKVKSTSPVIQAKNTNGFFANALTDDTQEEHDKDHSFSLS